MHIIYILIIMPSIFTDFTDTDEKEIKLRSRYHIEPRIKNYLAKYITISLYNDYFYVLLNSLIENLEKYCHEQK